MLTITQKQYYDNDIDDPKILVMVIVMIIVMLM